ncbi:hypothetical protein BLNAU_7261 [Blattamonas nauphoetae]|uniref:Uncharacterized protein n=1 Tax=Blattamonas nauphoetae TaxID=2049346 RepID=A0ABQ9Y261_9EUKA|nr:hypothetical protein BLNAU_7261 [Blattamonas nauphoetae]
MSLYNRVFLSDSWTRTPHRADNLPTIDPLQEPFLTFDTSSELCFEDKSDVYCSLVALVKAEYPFDSALQERAALFLKSLEPKVRDETLTNKLVTHLVPSSAGSCADFVESISTLLSSSHSTVVAAALSFFQKTTLWSTPLIQGRLAESKFIANILETVQPHTLPIAANKTVFETLIKIIDRFVNLASPWSLQKLDINEVADKRNHREMIFQKIVLPSSQFVTFLISNRHIFNEDLLRSFMFLLDRLLRTCPFHRPTLEFVFTSPIVMALSSCISIVENDDDIWNTLITIKHLLKEWKEESAEVVQSGKRMMKALFSEGFGDTLEQMMKQDKDTIHDLFEDSFAFAQHVSSTTLHPPIQLR